MNTRLRNLIVGSIDHTAHAVAVNPLVLKLKQQLCERRVPEHYIDHAAAMLYTVLADHEEAVRQKGAPPLWETIADQVRALLDGQEEHDTLLQMIRETVTAHAQDKPLHDAVQTALTSQGVPTEVVTGIAALLRAGSDGDAEHESENTLSTTTQRALELLNERKTAAITSHQLSQSDYVLCDQDALHAAVNQLDEDDAHALTGIIEQMPHYRLEGFEQEFFVPKALLESITAHEHLAQSEHVGTVLTATITKLNEKTLLLYADNGIEFQGGQIREKGTDDWRDHHVELIVRDHDSDEQSISDRAWIVFDQQTLEEAIHEEVYDAVTAYNDQHPDDLLRDAAVVNSIHHTLSAVPIKRIKQLDNQVCTQRQALTAIQQSLWESALRVLHEAGASIDCVIADYISDATDLSQDIATAQNLVYDLETVTFAGEEPTVSRALRFLSQKPKYLSQMRLLHLKDVALETIWETFASQWKAALEDGAPETIMIDLDGRLTAAYRELAEASTLVTKDALLDAMKNTIRSVPEADRKKVLTILSACL